MRESLGWRTWRRTNPWGRITSKVNPYCSISSAYAIEFSLHTYKAENHHSNVDWHQETNSLLLVVSLCKSETLRALLDGFEQVRAQLIIRLVRGQIELVEARVRRRQPVSRAVVAVDLKLLRPVHPLKGREALKRHLGRPSHKLHEFGLIRLVKRTQGSPEPDDLQRVGLVLVVLCVGLEIVDVNVGQSRQQQLEFLLVEDGDESTWYYVVEAFQECGQLLPYSTGHLHLAHKAHVVVFVFLGNLENSNCTVSGRPVGQKGNPRQHFGK